LSKDISSASKAKRFLAQKDNRDKIDEFDRDVMKAHLRFQVDYEIGYETLR
jgi:hypothetical protein